MHFTSRIPLRYGVVDLFVFITILVTARASVTSRYPGIPNILDVILRDATLYFLLIVASQLVLFFFLFFAPVGGHITSGVGCSCFAHRLCMFRRKFSSCPGCMFSPP